MSLFLNGQPVYNLLLRMRVAWDLWWIGLGSKNSGGNS